MNYISSFSHSIMLDILLILNWWTLSPYSLLLIGNHFINRYNKSGLIEHSIALFIYIIYCGINILSSCLIDCSTFYGTWYYQVVPNIIYGVNIGSALLYMRYLIYFATIFTYGELINEVYKNSHHTYPRHNDIPSVKIMAVLAINGYACIIVILVIGTINSEYSDNINNEYNINISLSLVFYAISQFLIYSIICYSILQNWKNNNNIEEHNRQITSVTCHSGEITYYDYFSDYSTYLLAGSIISAVYLNIIIFIFIAAFTFEFSRKWMTAIILIPITVNVIISLIQAGIDNLIKKICENKTPIRIIDSFYFISGIMLIIRINEMLMRLFLLILLLPIDILNCKNKTYFSNSYNVAYSRMILGERYDNDAFNINNNILLIENRV